MKAIKIANKLISAVGISFLSIAIAWPLAARAEYYLVYGPPDVPVVCDTCARTYYRPVHKHKVHQTKYKKRYYYPTNVRKRSHYSITVYYPVPTYVQMNPCTCCGGFIAPTYVWVPTPSRVYYAHPNDRLVGNRYEESFQNPSLDTGTADNDIY